MTKRAVLVARVSTKKQKDNYSSDTQIKRMGEYAASLGFSETIEIKDVCSGTVPIYERPEGRRLYQLIKARSIDAVIFYTFDRASREEYGIDFLILQRDLAQSGIELHITDKGKIGDDSFSRMLSYMGITQSSDERKQIWERSMRGRRAKAAVTWVGVKVPYGYRKIGIKREARLVIDPEQTAVIRRIFEMYTGPGFVSMYTIANTLTAEGVPTPMGARAWWQGCVSQLLSRRLFIGEVEYAGIKTAMPELAIIDPSTFEAAQERIRKNKAQAQRNRKNDYLLAGFIRCHCGRAECKVSFRYGDYYRCNGSRSGLQAVCHERSLKLDKIDSLVWEAVTRGLSREVLIEGLQAQNKLRAAELTPKRERLDSLNDLISRLGRKIKRYLDKFGDEENEKLADEAEELARSTAKQREAFVEERRRLELELKNHAFTEEQQSAILARAERLRRKVMTGKPTLAQRREFLRTLDLQVTIGPRGQEMKVSYILGDITLPIESASCLSRLAVL